MFAKVHPAEDVKSGNTGSCHDLVRYLEKETGEGQRFFSHTEQDISPERVIMDIDGNKKALGANDAKFFMLSLNPSQSEQMHLIGRKVDDFKELTPQEKKEVFQKLEAFTRSAMDEYALNFGRDNIRGGQDLMYYARVETERSYHPEDEEVKQGIARIGEPKPGLNLHVHVIVSRKSLDGKVKLSPGAKSAGNTWELEGRGTVKRGFSHEGWKVRVQECFNRKFDYQAKEGKYSINSLVYWVTYVHNVVYSFYRSMIYCYINSTQRCAGSIVIDIIPTNGADKRKFFPFAPYFPVTNVIKRYFYPYFPAIIGIKGYSFPYFPYLSGIMKIKTALYSLFSRLDWHKTVVFPCLGEIYEGIRSLSWEIPVT